MTYLEGWLEIKSPSRTHDSAPLIDKLEVYRGLGVREVWLFRNHTFEVMTLKHDQYELIERSQVFPEADLSLLARYALVEDQHAALKAFRDELRRQVQRRLLVGLPSGLAKPKSAPVGSAKNPKKDHEKAQQRATRAPALVRDFTFDAALFRYPALR